jgi:hypothetical protein
MTDEMKAIRDDIAFMRALAEEGRQAPLLGGGMLVAAGVIFGLASLFQWATGMGVLRISPWGPIIVWVGSGLIFAVFATLIIRRSRGQPGAQATVNRATGSAWSAVGFSMFVIWVGLAVIAYRTRNAAVIQVFPLIILALYGAAWSIAASMTHNGWMRVTSLGCFAAAMGLGFLADSPHMLLAYAACLAVFAILPGLALMRQEPSDIV